MPTQKSNVQKIGGVVVAAGLLFEAFSHLNHSHKLTLTKDASITACGALHANGDAVGTATVTIVNSTQDMQMYFVDVEWLQKGKVVGRFSGAASDVIPGEHTDIYADSIPDINGPASCKLSYASRQSAESYFDGLGGL